MRKTSQFSLEEIQKYTYLDLIYVRAHFQFLMDVILPLIEQESVLEEFRDLMQLMYNNAEYGVIFGLGRLIDNKDDKARIHFKRFCKEAQNAPLTDIRNETKWKEFCNDSALFLKEVRELADKLGHMRNSEKAHLMPGRPRLLSGHEGTWGYWDDVLKMMEGIYALFEQATNTKISEKYQRLRLKPDANKFLSWCRLDNFGQYKHKGGKNG